MSATFPDDQQAFAESLERVLGDIFAFERRQAALRLPQSCRDEDWQQLVDLGCMAAPFPESHGGLGGGAVELMVIAERFGRHLVTGPYFASVVLGGHAVLFGGSDLLRADVLPKVADGTMKLALAITERQARYDLHDVALVARPSGDGFELSGVKDVVLHGTSAGLLIVSARTSGQRRDRDGITLFAVPADTPGILQTSWRTHDGNLASSIVFDRVRADQVLGEPGEGLAILERVADHAIAFLCADAAGSMWRVHETTLEYLKTRRQFDRPLGTFQVLQHRMVDLYMDCELAWSMVLEVTDSLARAPRQRREAVSVAKVAVGEAARRVAEEGVQLHGGVGMTMDAPVGHHLKRAMAMNASFGDPGHHLDFLASIR